MNGWWQIFGFSFFYGWQLLSFNRFKGFFLGKVRVEDGRSYRINTTPRHHHRGKRNHRTHPGQNKKRQGKRKVNF